jgi:hypothetical protein
MNFFHRGVPLELSVTPLGNAFVASALILEEDGHATSLGKLGIFANAEGALKFAVRSATAFIDGDVLPLPPFQAT